jgi:hypothetical protein
MFNIYWGGNFIAKTPESRKKAEEMVAEHKANRVPIRAGHEREFCTLDPEPEYSIVEC